MEPRRGHQCVVPVVSAARHRRLAGHLENHGRDPRPTHDPNQLSNAAFSPPGAQYWFGTDVHGRDVFSRILFGAQISLLVGIVGAGVSLVIGVLWGAIAGYVGGRVDNMLMRVVDILYSLPTIIFVIVLITTLGDMLKQSHFIAGSPALQSALRVVFCLSAWARCRG